jgi:hypothetical protein
MLKEIAFFFLIMVAGADADFRFGGVSTSSTPIGQTR